VPRLRLDLLRAQDRLKGGDFPVILVIAGVDGAGKGESVNLLHEWLDARYLSTYAYDDPSDEERERPAFWRFWRDLPPHGGIGIFFGGWYVDPVRDFVHRASHKARLHADLARINRFEKELVDDGALVVKLWYHLSRRAQKKRLKELESDPQTR